MSSRQSPAAASGRAAPRLPAIDLIGASELLSSWPMTRIRRCQASRSCSRSGWLRSGARATRAACRPARTCGAGSPIGRRRRESARSLARRRLQRSRRGRAPRRAGRGVGRVAAEQAFAVAVDQRQPLLRVEGEDRDVDLRHHRASSAVASCAPSRCARSVSASAFTSSITCPRASSATPPRARIEKSSSRSAASRFETVCSGRTIARGARRRGRARRDQRARATEPRTSQE